MFDLKLQKSRINPDSQGGLIGKPSGDNQEQQELPIPSQEVKDKRINITSKKFQSEIKLEPGIALLLEVSSEEGYKIFCVQLTGTNDNKDTTLTFYRGNPKLVTQPFKKTFKDSKICSPELLRANEEIMIFAVLIKSGDQISKPSITFSILKPEEKTLKNLFVIRALPHHKKFFGLERHADNNIRLFVLVAEGKGIFYNGRSDVDFSGSSEAFELIEVEEGLKMIDVSFVEDRASLGVIILILWQDTDKGLYFMCSYRNIKSEMDERKWVMTGKHAVVGEQGASCQWAAFIYDEEKGGLIVSGLGSKQGGKDIYRIVIQLQFNIEMRSTDPGMSPNRFELQDPLVLLRCLYIGPQTPSIESTPLPNYQTKLVRANLLYLYQEGVVDRIDYHQDAETGAWLIRLAEKAGPEEEKLKDIIGVGNFDDKNSEINYERDDRLPSFFMTRDFEVLLEDG